MHFITAPTFLYDLVERDVKMMKKSCLAVTQCTLLNHVCLSRTMSTDLIVWTCVNVIAACNFYTYSIYGHSRSVVQRSCCVCGQCPTARTFVNTHNTLFCGNSRLSTDSNLCARIVLLLVMVVVSWQFIRLAIRPDHHGVYPPTWLWGGGDTPVAGREILADSTLDSFRTNFVTNWPERVSHCSTAAVVQRFLPELLYNTGPVVPFWARCASFIRNIILELQSSSFWRGLHTESNDLRS